MTQQSQWLMLLGLFLLSEFHLSGPQSGCSRMVFEVSFGSHMRQSPAFLGASEKSGVRPRLHEDTLTGNA